MSNSCLAEMSFIQTSINFTAPSLLGAGITYIIRNQTNGKLMDAPISTPTLVSREQSRRPRLIFEMQIRSEQSAISIQRFAGLDNDILPGAPSRPVN